MQQFPYHTRTDGRIFGLGKEENRIDATQLAIDIGYTFFVLKILYSPDATENDSSFLLLSKIDGQSARPDREAPCGG